MFGISALLAIKHNTSLNAFMTEFSMIAFALSFHKVKTSTLQVPDKFTHLARHSRQ
jgi:hypothetical protein